MISLKEFLESKNWSDSVDTSWKPKEGLFTKKDPQKIADYLLSHSKDEAQAMQRLVFYMNRAGDNLTNKAVLNKVKSLLKKEKIDEAFANTLNIDKPKTKTYSNMICVSLDNKILVLRRSNYMRKFKSLWGFPGGFVDDKDKDSKQAAIRELKEETGIELTWNEENRFLKKLRSIKNDDGSVSEYWIVNLERQPEITLSREHSKYDWIDDDSKDVKRWMPDVYQIIQKYYIDE